MPRAILATLGARDRLLVDGAAVLAAHCNVTAGAVMRLDDLAEHALHPQDGALAACFAGETSFVVAGAAGCCAAGSSSRCSTARISGSVRTR